MVVDAPRPNPRGPGGARPPRHATTAAAVFVQLALRWRRNWAAQWHLAQAAGKCFRGAAQSASKFISAFAFSEVLVKFSPIFIYRFHRSRV